MCEIPMEKALEAYNTIREYCGRHKNCEGCLFQMDEEDNEYIYNCIFPFEESVENWPDLDLN